MIDTITVREFIENNKLTMQSAAVDRNPNMDSSAEMDHWKIELEHTFEAPVAYDSLHTDKPKTKIITNRMTLYFSMGFGHNGKAPDIASVLECLVLDSQSIDNNNFKDWCAELGYDPDSRRAERTYNTCKHQASRFRQFLGGDLYDMALRQVVWE